MALANKEVKQLIDSIFNEAGITNLDEGSELMMKTQLEQQLNERIGLTIMNSLDDKALNAYLKLMEKPENADPKKIQAFLEEKLPNYQEVLTEAITNFKKEFINAVK